MAFNISKLPRGLAALLNLRSNGDTPQLLADQVVGVLDMMPLYLLDTRELVSGFANNAPVVGANSFTVPMRVPPGELWYVWGFLVAADTGAGEAIDIAAAINLDGLAITVPVDDYKTAAANQNVRSFARDPFWAPAGSEFRFLVRSVTGAPDCSGAAVVTKLRV